MTRRLRTLLRDDAGFSLVEMLSALAIGGIVLTALMGVFVNGVRGTTGIQNRVDNSARARIALDRVVRLLDSQVCPQPANTDVGTPPVLAGDASNVASFFADLNGGNGPSSAVPSADYRPYKYTLTYVPSTKVLTLDTYTYNTTAQDWTTKQGPTVRIAADVVPQVVGGVAQPIFTYYPYVSVAANGLSVGDVSPNPAPVPLTPAVAPTIVKIGVQFAAISSTSHRDDRQHAYVSGSGAISTFNADPTTPSVCP